MFAFVRSLNVKAWLSDYFLELSMIFLPVVFSLGQYGTSDEALKMLAPGDDRLQHIYRKLSVVGMSVSFGLYVIASICHIREKKRISQLVAENLRLQSDLEAWSLDLEALAQGYVVFLAQQLGFGTREIPTERITIYAHDTSANNGVGVFIPFGRFSYNTKYSEKGRETYPDGQGCIAETWKNGQCFINDYPVYKEGNPKEYIKRAAKDGFEEKVVKALKMKSRLYFGWRIMDTKSYKPLAVVIVESTDQNRWQKETLEQVFTQQNRYLSDVMERLKPRLPHLTNARKAGF